MNNRCFVIQNVNGKLLLCGNSKTKIEDPAIPLYTIDKNGSNCVIDLATHQVINVNEKNIKLSDIYNVSRESENKTYFIRPDMFPLLSSNNDIMKGVNQTDKLRTMVIDIETLSTGGNPYKPLSSPIISIAIKEGNDDTFVIMDYDPKYQDKHMLEFFVKEVKDYDPDIIIAYNAFFDIPYIIIRAMLHRLTLDIARPYGKNRSGYITSLYKKGPEDVYRMFEKTSIQDNKTLRDFIKGRVIYDAYLDARLDQSLTGKVKDRGLKTVANYYGFGGYKLEDEDYSNMKSLINTEKLAEYNKSDVDITYKLANNVYLPVAMELSELSNIPVGNILNADPSYMSSVISARELTRINMYPFETNRDRYSRYSDLMYRDSKSNKSVIETIYQQGTKDDSQKIKIINLDDNENDLITTTFEGAYCFQSEINKGYIDKVWKYDFSSYYPSAIMSLNLGPDTTRIIEFRELREGNKDIYIDHIGDNIRLYVQDHSFKREVVIDVDMSKISFYKKEVMELKKRRTSIQKKMKQAEQDNNISMYNHLFAQQSAIKVKMNIYYGASGIKYSKYGDYGTAIGILGFCRDSMKHLCKEIIGYDKIVEIDTDGTFIKERLDLNRINREISKYVTDKYKVKNFLSLDEDEYLNGYFLMKKNYAVRLLDGTIYMSGISLKGSNKPLLFDKAKEKLITKILIDKEKDYFQVVNEISDLNSYKWPKDFIITTTAKDKTAYINQTSQPYKVMIMCEKYMEIRQGDILKYVYTKKGIKPVNALDSNDIYDIDKYYTYIDSLIKTFDLKEVAGGQLNLF